MRTEMMDPMLQATPTFEPVWNAFLAEWNDGREPLPIYLVFSDLARHITKLIENSSKAELVKVFRVVEMWCDDGDDEVQESVTVGLLEDLHNTNVVGMGKPEKIEQYLGPQSKRGWQKVQSFWAKGELISDN
ncbi:hypothetical protein [Acaryochloris sp. IP29b_bin.148]|uniref:DUF7674 family protein n=1 Tax=Acaryochloris sp. IP29b_bin.148 TaxID=2969218 RepID=UPI002614831B|nr:hypothetical protein [Acaryochloris sp. IP29b_bin.148]